MKNLEEHYEIFSKLKDINDEKTILNMELFLKLQNYDDFVKISLLIQRLSKKRHPVWREHITKVIERLKNGETPESIIVDLEKLVDDNVYVRQTHFETNLVRIRKASGLTQTQLSERSGVNVRMIQYYEQGVKDINKAQAITVYKLAEALGCNMRDLIER